MAITAAQVKELREMTGAGMMDCFNGKTLLEKEKYYRLFLELVEV